MRIVIDAAPLASPTSGIGTYTVELTRALVRLAPADELIFSDATVPFGRRPVRLDALDAHVAETSDRVRRRWKWSWYAFPFQTRWAVRRWAAARLRPDVYFGPAFFGAFGRGFRTVITIHDMSYVRYPQYSAPSVVEAFGRLLPEHARRADAILADSESTRRDVVEFLGVPPEKVHTVLLGLDERFRRVEDSDVLAAVRARYRLPGRYLLHVGTVEPRKNLVCLLGAFERLASRKGFDHDLVLAGPSGWSNDEFFGALGRSRFKDRVHLIGKVDFAHLPAVYSLASVFVFPSVFEGFGFPPLEAMGCGVPVVASTASSVPEVVGDAGLLADPFSPDEFGDKIRAVLETPALAADLRAGGLTRAATFTWDRAARQTLTVLESLSHR